MGTARVAGTAWGMGRVPCASTPVTRDSLPWARRAASLCSSQGQIFPIQAIMGGGSQGRGHSGTLSGAGAPHGSVFFRKRKKKLVVNINHISRRKNVCSPHACLFISPGSTEAHCCGDPLALPSVPGPPPPPRLCSRLTRQLLPSRLWLLKAGLRLPPSPPRRPSSLVVFQPLRFLTLHTFPNLPRAGLTFLSSFAGTDPPASSLCDFALLPSPFLCFPPPLPLGLFLFRHGIIFSPPCSEKKILKI